jgi:hypothetical protein
MDNLLFALWTRTEKDNEVTFAGEWLFHWRRAVPWRCDKTGGMARLAPRTPQHQCTYRFNVIEVKRMNLSNARVDGLPRPSPPHLIPARTNGGSLAPEWGESDGGGLVP